MILEEFSTRKKIKQLKSNMIKYYINGINILKGMFN